MPVETIHFEDFELDRRAYELRCGGSIVHLERIPFDLLNLLIERRGELVTRKEILEQIWGKDVFVDGDNGINTAVRKIRLALKEDPENPRFLRTVPGKGYRFAAEHLAEKARDAAADGGARSPVAGNSLPRKQWMLWVTLGLPVVIGIAAVLFALNVQGWRGRLLRTSEAQYSSSCGPTFANLSGDPEQEYFADGMTEELITELGKISTPHVISRQSVMQYKGSTKPLQEIARELNVDAVLQGSVERSGDRVRVIVHLDQVAPESQLWTNQYDRDIRDVLRLQDEIARTVTDEIQVPLKPHVCARLAGSRPVDPEAQDDYFRALHSEINGPSLQTSTASRTFSEQLVTSGWPLRKTQNMGRHTPGWQPPISNSVILRVGATLQKKRCHLPTRRQPGRWNLIPRSARLISSSPRQ